MRKSIVLVGLVFGLLLVGSAMAAPSKHHSSKMSNSPKMSGTIVTTNNSEIVLSSKANGKSGEEKFLVNPQTKTKGTLSTGERATVRYKNENGQKVATVITAHKNTTSKMK